MERDDDDEAFAPAVPAFAEPAEPTSPEAADDMTIVRTQPDGIIATLIRRWKWRPPTAAAARPGGTGARPRGRVRSRRDAASDGAVTFRFGLKRTTPASEQSGRSRFGRRRRRRAEGGGGARGYPGEGTPS